jgi:hypothetical protein
VHLLIQLAVIANYNNISSNNKVVLSNYNINKVKAKVKARKAEDVEDASPVKEARKAVDKVRESREVRKAESTRKSANKSKII